MTKRLIDVKPVLEIGATEQNYLEGNALKRQVDLDSKILQSEQAEDYIPRINTAVSSWQKRVNRLPDFAKKFINYMMGLAVDAHKGTRRADNWAYTTHPIEIANIVSPYFGASTGNSLTARVFAEADSLGHDIVEYKTEEDFASRKKDLLESISRMVPKIRSQLETGQLKDEGILRALRYMLFRDLPHDDSARVNDYNGIIYNFRKALTNDLKGRSQPLVGLEAGAVEGQINKSIDRAIENILENQTRTSLKYHYLDKFEKEISWFASRHVDWKSRKTVEEEMKLLRSPSLERLSRYGGPIQSYLEYVTSISPVHIILSEGKPGGEYYDIDFVLDDMSLDAHSALMATKLGDRMHNNITLYNFLNRKSVSSLQRMEHELMKALREGGIKGYNAEKERFTHSYLETNREMDNWYGAGRWLDGSKRVYELFKSFVAINHILQVTYHREMMGDWDKPRVKAVKELGMRAAASLAEQARIQAVRLHINNPEIDIATKREIDGLLRQYERNGGLDSISTPHQMIDDGTKYRIFDGLFGENIMPRMMDIAEGTKRFSQNVRERYMAAIAMMRIGEKYIEQQSEIKDGKYKPGFYVKGFELLEPPAARNYIELTA